MTQKRYTDEGICDCGNKATRRKQGQWVCPRCEKLEKQSAWHEHCARDRHKANDKYSDGITID